MDAQVSVHRAGQQLGAAEIDADDASLGHAGHLTAPWQTTAPTPRTARAPVCRGSAATIDAAASRASPSAPSLVAVPPPRSRGAAAASPSAACSATSRSPSPRGC